MPLNLTELFLSPAAAAPQGPRKADLPTALREAFVTYHEAVGDLETATWLGSEVASGLGRSRALASRMLEALEAALRGQPSQARAAFDDGMTSVAPEIATLTSIPLTDQTLGVLYRVRKEAPHHRFGPKDLSHIPFELLHIVRPQRYSVPGVPMLYLSSTLLACWEEMGRPDPRHLWAAAFRLRKGRELRVINLAYRPKAVANTARNLYAGQTNGRTELGALLAAHAVVWPLVLACSYSVLFRDTPFVPEYVIPQLLTSWVAEREQYAGIRYFSTRMSAETGPGSGSNFALPAREYAPTGHCRHLMDLFEISQPYSWIHADALGLFRSSGNHVRNDFTMLGEEEQLVTYAGTTFGQMESVLAQYGWPRDHTTSP